MAQGRRFDSDTPDRAQTAPGCRSGMAGTTRAAPVACIIGPSDVATRHKAVHRRRSPMPFDALRFAVLGERGTGSGVGVKHLDITLEVLSGNIVFCLGKA